MLETTPGKDLCLVVSRVVDKSVVGVGHIQAGNRSMVTENAEVRVRGNEIVLEQLLAHCRSIRVLDGTSVVLH